MQVAKCYTICDAKGKRECFRNSGANRKFEAEDRPVR